MKDRDREVSFRLSAKESAAVLDLLRKVEAGEITFGPKNKVNFSGGLEHLPDAERRAMGKIIAEAEANRTSSLEAMFRSQAKIAEEGFDAMREAVQKTTRRSLGGSIFGSAATIDEPWNRIQRKPQAELPPLPKVWCRKPWGPPGKARQINPRFEYVPPTITHAEGMERNFKRREWERTEALPILRQWLPAFDPDCPDWDAVFRILTCDPFRFDRMTIEGLTVDDVVAYFENASPMQTALQREGRRHGNDGAKTIQLDRATTWPTVQQQLIRLADQGEAYTSTRELAKRLGVSTGTISKACNPPDGAIGRLDTDTERRDAERAAKRIRRWVDTDATKRGAKAIALTEVITDCTAQTTEQDPSSRLADDEVDALMAKLIDQAEPEKRAELNELDDEGRRKIAALFAEQCKDSEPSPFDAVGNRVRTHKRV